MLKKIPHTYVIIFYIIIFASVLTWIVPGGRFEREKIIVNGSEKSVIVQGSFHNVPHKVQTWQIFSAMFKGFNEKSDIIIFIFMVGGAFMIITKTRAIDIGIFTFLKYNNKLKKKKIFRKIDIDNIIIAVTMIIYSLFGAVFGMSEETIPFIMILVPVAISMGYDSIVGVSLVFLAAGLGFAGAFLNPFTVGVAQGIAGITPLFSGIEYRLFAWLVINITGITYVILYARKIKANPKLSYVYKEDEYWRKRTDDNIEKIEKTALKSAWLVFGIISTAMIFFSFLYPYSELKIGNKLNISGYILPIITGFFIVLGFLSIRKSSHFFILLIITLSIIILIIGVMGFGWYVLEIATMFFAMGIAAGISKGFSPSKIANYFLLGVKDIAAAAIIVGFAGGIIEILNDGQIIDTILYSVSNSITGFGKVASITMMYIFQSMLNLLIPSGSGQAALTMPIMAPLSDLLGISRQAAVMAFQFGDGFTNMITPTSGVLIGVLGVAKIPFEKWFKFIFPFMMIIIIVALLLLIPTVTMDLPGF